MSFIRTRKKLVSSAIVSSLSLVATTAAIAADDATELPTIYSHASASNSLKVDKSANKKYVAPLLDTPKSVAVVSQKLLQETNTNSLTQALQNVPGITLGAGEGGTPFTDMPYIRGYSSQSSIFVDGIRNSTSQNRDMFAVEQVEVTKGSSSTIAGGGGVGGSINLITKVAHQGDKYQGSIQGGTDNYRHIMLDANKDFGNGVAGRVVVMGHQNDKPGSIDGAEYNRVGIAPSLAWGLGTATRGTLSYYYLQSYDEPDAGIPFATTGGKPIYVKQGTYYGWKNRDFDKRENHIGTLKLEHDFNDNLTLSNTASYTKSKSDYVYTNADDSKGNVAAYGTISRRALTRIVDTDAISDQLALTGKFNTGRLKHSFNVGTEWSYQASEQGVHTFTNSQGTTSTVHSTNCNPATTTNIGGWCTSVANPTNGLYTDTLGTIKNQYTTRSTTASVYALDSIEFTPQWLLNLGVRWDKFDTQRKYYKNVTSGTTTTPAGTVIESNSDFFSYQAGLVFKPTENGSIYASFATSANPVGMDQGDGADSISATYKDLEPEKARTFEIGTKWDLFNNRANLTAAVFRTEKQNTRVLTDANTYSNVGSSRVDGFEIGLNGKITDKLEVSTGYSYLDSELTKSAYNATATVGRPLPFVAKNSATLWTTYKVLPKLTIGAGAQYKDQVYANITSNKYLPAYTIYNAMAKYDVNRNVNIQLNVNNISNKRYFTSAQASHFAIEGDGRNAVLAINFKY
ncbi:TonB-dependent siderophore receptor [Acinetobacter sp. ME22]|uniref:TonB-dependent receptor n=1 Tax=Acinetobacter sp. ME22 TaxID=2904802 RepID=UPI001ED9F0D1|nr:TonB-dependent siderophore receptor [Acinetobacter sp. ME22]MCG2573182.1 TonB-dependent siderophore receptor [Acinetobacter sp. ME22]